MIWLIIQTASLPVTKALYRLFSRFNITPKDLANVLSCVPGYHRLSTGDLSMFCESLLRNARCLIKPRNKYGI